MGRLEKILLIATVFLVVLAVFLLAAPDSRGRSGLDAVSPLLAKIGAYTDYIIAEIRTAFSQMSSSLKPPAREGTSPSGGSAGQTNPFESAIGPAAGYGEAQKDVYEKPLEGLTR